MKLRGISESDISFENTVTAQDYSNALCDAHKDPNDCKIFATGGGGQNYLNPPSGSAAAGSEWIFTGANNVGTAAYPIGTTAAGTGNDLILLLPNANMLHFAARSTATWKSAAPCLPMQQASP
jgi:hypothetical protein